jgi:hypothetical protein
MVLRVRSPRTEPLRAPVDHLGDRDHLPWAYCSRRVHARCRRAAAVVDNLSTVVQGAAVRERVSGGDDEEDDADAETHDQPHH